MGNQISDRIAEEQARSGQAQADDQGAPQEGQIDAKLDRTWGDAAVDPALQVQGVQIVAVGEALAGLANRVPGLHVVPRGVDANQCSAPRRVLRFAQAPRRAGDDGPQAAVHAIDTHRNPPQGALLTRSAQFAGDRLVHRLGRGLCAVPVLQQAQGCGQRIRHYRVIHAARQHGRQGRDEAQPDKGDQGENQTHSAELRAGQRTSHALKRSFISSP
jgi:hypothetical protein